MQRFSRASAYRKAVDWIAMNDGPGDTHALNAKVIQSQVSVVLVADLFDKDCLEVAKDVVNDRKCAERRKAW